jgi:hypothetical protein
MSTFKTIKISEENHKQLSNLGKIGETYDDIVSQLLESKKENKGD